MNGKYSMPFYFMPIHRPSNAKHDYKRKGALASNILIKYHPLLLPTTSRSEAANASKGYKTPRSFTSCIPRNSFFPVTKGACSSFELPARS